MSKYEEESKLLLSGDETFIRNTYKEAFPSISKLIKQNSGTESEAEDVFQEALAMTYKKLRDGELTLDCSLKTFLFATSRNMWLYRLRSKKRQVNQPDLEVHQKISDIDLIELTEEQERIATYQKHFKKLDEACKNLLKLYFEGTSMQEIAIKLNYSSPGYARKKKFKCKEKLIKSIKSDPFYNELVEKE